MAALKEMLDEANSKLNALKDELNQVNRRIEEQAIEAKAPARPRPASFYRYDFDDFFDDNNESTTPPPCYETTSIVSDIMAIIRLDWFYVSMIWKLRLTIKFAFAMSLNESYMLIK